jgi:cell wall-associated NlpC family hydrolase
LSLKLKDIVGNIFYTDKKEKEAEQQKTTELQQKTSQVFGTNDKSENATYNPFLKKDGTLVNPLLNYQKLLDNPSISQKAKNYISQATGLSPTATNITTQSNNGVTPTQFVSSEHSIGATNSNIVNAAKNYIGTPYVWGGESMSEGGMDCSGFVYNALKDAGYNVGRTTAQGYRSNGTVVNKSDLQPGDLIFYGKDNNASHIGIYIGNRQMVHSSGGSKNTASNPGKGVSVTNVDYRSDFLEARRY